MIKSMTAFSRKAWQNHEIMLTWEIKAVNHRYLDLTFRLPDGFREIENDLRMLIKQYVTRGKIECSLRCQQLQTEQNQIMVDHNLLKQYVSEIDKIELLSATNIDLTRLLLLPNVLHFEPADLTKHDEICKQIFSEALEKLVIMRENEGARLAQFIQERLQQVTQIINHVRQNIPDIRKQLRTKLTTKLDEITQSINYDRLEQELIYAAQKMDVDEELDRLGSHVNEVSQLLKTNDAVGRRLDFLMQEFNREANTLASKSVSTDITSGAVDLKVLIEQMREQVQNIE